MYFGIDHIQEFGSDSPPPAICSICSAAVCRRRRHLQRQHLWQIDAAQMQLQLSSISKQAAAAVLVAAAVAVSQQQAAAASSSSSSKQH